VTADTYDAWLEGLKVMHVDKGGRCAGDGREWPCNMHRLIERAEEPRPWGPRPGLFLDGSQASR
jgi:hypothetical protein